MFRKHRQDLRKQHIETKPDLPIFTFLEYPNYVIVKSFPKNCEKAISIRKQSKFRKHYLRRDIPISINYNAIGKLDVQWQIDMDELDVDLYLPLFFEGLIETDEYPYDLIVMLGIRDILTYCSNKILPVIPKLVMPLKKALNTRNKKIVSNTLIVLQNLVLSDITIGRTFICYYTHILPSLRLLVTNTVNIGDQIDYSQRTNIYDLVEQTLSILEKTGGCQAYTNIKYMIPTYESCMYNP